SPNLSNGTWVESTWNLHPSGETWQQHLGDATPVTETAASKENFANWIQQTFRGNLLTNVNGIQPTNLQGIPDYTYVYGSLYPDPNTGTADAAYTYMAGGNDTNNSAHALIEPPRLTGAASYYKPTEDIKYSRGAALYIVANTTSAVATNAHKPDGTVISVAPQSIRCFMNDTTGSTPVITEVVLPGQTSWGFNTTTNLGYDNTWSSHKTARPIVTMFDIYYDGTTPNFYKAKSTRRRMYDMRRTAGGDPSNDSTTTFDQSTARSSTNKYVPKNIDMIDIDLTELKRALRTIGIGMGTSSTSAAEFYATGMPTSGN
ncbi:MAG: hypothetical protein ABUL65_04880, partial [Opitutus sp.]